MTPAMVSACEQFILTTIASAYPTLPVYMSGQPIKGNIPVYARFWVIASDESVPVGFGIDARSRNVGIIQVDVMGPKDQGAGETADIAKTFRDALHRLPIEVPGEGWVILKDATIKDIGDVGEEHRQMVRVPYRFDIAA
jgi:hypothetical protein